MIGKEKTKAGQEKTQSIPLNWLISVDFIFIMFILVVLFGSRTVIFTKYSCNSISTL